MAISVIRTKWALVKAIRAWNKKHPKDLIKRERMNMAWPRWGNKARINAWRYTGKHGKPSARLDNRLIGLLYPNRVPRLKIIKVKLKWAQPLVPRNGPPSHIVWHHAAAKVCSIFTIHRWHLNNGWSGFAYMYLVRKNGKIYEGRPEGMCGGHTYGWPGTIAAVFEGNFDNERMGDKQLRAGQALHRHLHSEYKGVPDRGHGSMPGNATGCPGRYLPLGKITAVK